MPNMTYEELLAENQQLRIKIKELEQENARLKERNVQLLFEPELPAYSSRRSMTVEEKEEELKRRVTLFRSLLKGRENSEIFSGNLLRHIYASKTKSLTQKETDLRDARPSSGPEAHLLLPGSEFRRTHNEIGHILYRISLPNGNIEDRAILKCCRPKGIPTMVMQKAIRKQDESRQSPTSPEESR